MCAGAAGVLGAAAGAMGHNIVLTHCRERNRCGVVTIVSANHDRHWIGLRHALEQTWICNADGHTVIRAPVMFLNSSK
eukprot:gene26088-50464_t